MTITSSAPGMVPVKYGRRVVWWNRQGLVACSSAGRLTARSLYRLTSCRSIRAAPSWGGGKHDEQEARLRAFREGKGGGG